MLEILRNLGFVLLGAVFAWAGGRHFLKFGEISGELKQRNFPYPVPLLAAGSVVELVAGTCLIVGFARVYASLALAAFTIAASLCSSTSGTLASRNGRRCAWPSS